MSQPPFLLSRWSRPQAICFAFAALCLLNSPGPARANLFGDDDPPKSLPPAAKQEIDFARDIAPILSQSCHRCHGPSKQKGGLSLHLPDKALAGGDSGPVIVPGKSEQSLLVQYVAGLEEENRMPPEGAGDPLTDAQVGLLRAWIDQGARWSGAVKAEATTSDHWSFRVPVRPTPPSVKNAAWPRNPIDQFILARLEHESLQPSKEAGRETLIRRLSLDLTGLPPTIAEIDAFLNDQKPDAYERLVDRLLASPHYGECWGRHWLDRSRYADTNGYEKDRDRSIWPYRDWVIRAINADMPFDQFTIEQIAGDLLPNATTDQRIATGFHRNTMINEEGGIDVEEFRFIATVDRVSTTGTVWLGLTVGCAQCHTHKYDPITQREYYQFFAFLNNADEPEIDVPDPEISQKRAAIEAKIADLTAGLEKVESPGAGPLDARIAAWEASLHPVHWTTLTPSRTISRKNATMTPLADDSILVSGDKPNNDVYEVDLPTTLEGITAIRLEVLTDPSLPEGGPGRAPLFQVGDFLLTEFVASASPAGEAEPGKEKALTFRGATEDYKAEGRSAAMAIDGITDTGWSVNGRVGMPHAAVFELSEPLGDRRGVRLHLTMHQEFIHQTTIGRFRISVTTDKPPVSASSVPAEIEEIVLIPPDSRSEEQSRRLRQYYVSIAPELAEARKPIEELKKSLPRLPTTMVMEERSPEHARTTHIHKRGEFLKLGDPVEPGVPAVLHPLPQAEKADRLAFARWLVDEKNPLVGRVAMNQVWQTLFGRGLVSTSEDFGTQGANPTHPELLDWLATEFIDQGWSQKAMLRAIVTSATYRQSSQADAELLAKDPRNDLLARGPRFRVSAETIRDIALSASGLLTPSLGGPSVYPPQPDGVTSLSYAQTPWPTSTGADRYRRGLYTFLKRTSPYAAFITMDGPTSDTSCVRRERSNTPLQALTSLNDTVFVEASRALARRVLTEAPNADFDDRLRLAYRLCLARSPRPEELSRIRSFYEHQISRFRSAQLDPGLVAGMPSNSTPPTPLLTSSPGVDSPELAAWTTVARVLLNLDETVTRE